MKINILYEFVDKPFGGANQFLKSLKNYFKQKEIYEEKSQKADLILFNSHLLGANKGEVFSKIINIKKQNPNIIIVHRVDGPVSLYQNSTFLNLDYFIFKFNQLLSDATIFQSDWSKKKNIEKGMTPSKQNITIINAPDKKIFYRGKRNLKSSKIKLVATSWSSNMNKGFETYKWIDKNLDFSKFEMTFVGNSPMLFENIKVIKPLTSKKLAEFLRKQDIFITASKKDPCSNSLIEALNCGLPALVLNDGGHPQIIGRAGETFDNDEEIPVKLEKIAKNLTSYKNKITLPNIDEVGEQYLNFFKTLKQNNDLTLIKIIKSYWYLFLYKSVFLLTSLKGYVYGRKRV